MQDLEIFRITEDMNVRSNIISFVHADILIYASCEAILLVLFVCLDISVEFNVYVCVTTNNKN